MKITIDRSLVEQALEALENYATHRPRPCPVRDVEYALRAALAEPVQIEEHCLWARNGKEPCPHVQQAEPVQVQDTDCHAQGICQRSGYSIGQRKPLSEEEIAAVTDEHWPDFVAFARAVEAAHGIGKQE